MEKFYGICVLAKYKVRIKYKSCYYCYTDFEGDGVFEKDKSVKTKTFYGYELLNEFSERFKDNDFFDFTTNGKTWHFGYFTPTNGSTTDVDYIILKEEYK